MINYELSFLIAVFAYVYSNILTDEDQLLNWVYNKLDQKIVRYRWIFHVVIHCEKCISGQAALWLYLYFNFFKYNFLHHLFFITFTILAAEFIKQIHKKIKQNTHGD